MVDVQSAQKPATTSRTLETIIQHAITLGVSDIHIERRDAVLSVRFRVDGVLRDINPPPLHVHEVLVSCIKVLARLRTDIRTLPQDGRYTYIHEGNSVDIRVSIIPAYWGEKVVLRLLYKPKNRHSLQGLGFKESDVETMTRAIHQPDGLVLVVGPTGSGKTTTLYELLDIVSRKHISVVSLEDPVEYGLDRVTQIPVQEKHQFTFATALRSVLRQDPDVLMVGEIRDAETAEIAATAALTGHLVLSTLHTLDVPRTITRLLTMGVPEHVVTPSLSLIVSQRLARRVCIHCKKRTPIPQWWIRYLKEKNVTLVTSQEMKGAGCKQCSQTGYLGRVVIYEMLPIYDDVRAVLRSHSIHHDILRKEFQRFGWRPLLMNGVDALEAEITNSEELMRVIQL